MRFRIGRLPVFVHLLLPLAMLLMAYMGAARGCLLAFCCVLLHELGHLIAATALGAQVLSLELMPLGGVLHIGGLYRLARIQVLIIAAAGPLISLLAVIAAMLFPDVFSFQFAWINLLLFAFNLLPGMPMDGGRMLAALLRKPLGIRRSVRIAARIGQWIGLLLLGTAVVQMLSGRGIPIPVLMMGVYLLACASKETKHCDTSAVEDVSRILDSGRFRQSLPVQALFCDDTISKDEILRTFRPDRCTLLLWKETAKFESDLQWLQRQIHT